MTIPVQQSPSEYTSEQPARVREADRGRKRLRFPETGVLLVVLIALGVFFAIRSPYFLNLDNITNILSAVAVVGLVACPATMLMIAGQFDLSVGSGVALVCSVFAVMVASGANTGLAVLVGVVIGLVLGIVNGLLVTVVGINALITTLGTLAIARGIAQLTTNGQSVGFNGFTLLGLGRPLLGVPWAVWILLIAVAVTAVVLRYTVFGRDLYAIGANPTAARLAGVMNKRVVFATFLISGLVVALGGLILASQTGQGSGNAAQGLELSAVTAVILGGASLAGGRGSVFGTFLGVVIIGVINNGLVLLNVQSFWQDVIRGALLIAAVGFDQIRQRMTRTA